MASEPLSWRELDVDAGGVRLHLRRLDAPTDGPPLVLLHGLGVSGAVWQSFGRRLAPPFTILAPDLRGHGRSEHPPTGYQPADYARDVDALLAALPIASACLAGHSLGALVALAMAAWHAPRVRALVLIDPPLDPARPPRDVETVYRLRHAPPGELERFLSFPLLAPLFRQASDAPFEAMLAAPPGAPWAWEAAPAIQAPVLLVQADPERDGVLGDQAAGDFLARLPHGRRLKLAGAAHAVHASHPAPLAAAMREFLADVLTGVAARCHR